MNDFVTLAVFQYPHEAHVLQSRLESEGITVFLKDELTVQSHNFLSQAVGGIKLQVPKQDCEKAKEIVEPMGILYVQDGEDSSPLKPIMDSLPFFKSYPPEVRFMVYSAIIVSIVVILALA